MAQRSAATGSKKIRTNLESTLALTPENVPDRKKVCFRRGLSSDRIRTDIFLAGDSFSKNGKRRQGGIIGPNHED